MPGLRRGLESVTTNGHGRAAGAMTTPEPLGTLIDTRRELQELVAAIDRRLPQVQRTNEAAIVEAAETLRATAMRRIEEIDREIADQGSSEPRPANVH